MMICLFIRFSLTFCTGIQGGMCSALTYYFFLTTIILELHWTEKKRHTVAQSHSVSFQVCSPDFPIETEVPFFFQMDNQIKHARGAVSVA